MGKIKLSASFLLGAIFFAACSAADIRFPYEWFHMSPIHVWDYPDGKLIGGGGVKYDLSRCKPIKNAQGKLVQQCVIVFYPELEKLITDYKQTKSDLIECQRGR